MKNYTQNYTEYHTENRQYNIFAVHVKGKLLVVETENLERCKLTPALGDVDVIEVIENHKRQKPRSNYQYYNYKQ